MNARRDALRTYFNTVVRDLLGRGIVRRAQGQGIEDILRQETPTVLREIQADFAAIGKEIGLTAALGVGNYARDAATRGVETVIGAALRKLDGLFNGPAKR